MMKILAVHHVQLAMPKGGEAEARRFYVTALGLSELEKPAALASRGGAWFRSEGVEIHLGVEDDFRPARKAHPALLVVGLPGMVQRLQALGFVVTMDVPLEGYDRVYVSDPFGNRIELLAENPSNTAGAQL